MYTCSKLLATGNIICIYLYTGMSNCHDFLASLAKYVATCEVQKWLPVSDYSHRKPLATFTVSSYTTS